MDGLDRRRIEIDMIKFSGPVFNGVDNRLVSLQLMEFLVDAYCRERPKVPGCLRYVSP